MFFRSDPKNVQTFADERVILIRFFNESNNQLNNRLVLGEEILVGIVSLVTVVSTLVVLRVFSSAFPHIVQGWYIIAIHIYVPISTGRVTIPFTLYRLKFLWRLWLQPHDLVS